MQKLLPRFSWFLVTGVSLLVSACSDPPEVTVEIPWSLSGEWLIADTHTHTTFTDGSLDVSELVERAITGGCDVLAITDHSDKSRGAVTPEYYRAIRAVRVQHPQLILFGGLEWNIPSPGGVEHAGVLVDPVLEEQLLPEFKQTFEGTGDTAAQAGLTWLATRTSGPQDAVLFYNHPSRKDQAATDNVEDILRWRQINTQLVGFVGGPGHQKSMNPGLYKGRFKTIDRWDPVVAETGGGWDQLLDQGHDLWGVG